MPWKPGARVLGIDDGPHVPGRPVDVVGVVCLAASGYVEAVLHTTVTHDGDDADAAITAMVRNARIYPNLVAVLIHNSTVAGFNTLDIDAIHAAIGRPVLAVSRGRQDWHAMRDALLAGIPAGPEKWRRIQGNEAKQWHHLGRTLVGAGIREDEACDLVDLCTLRGHLPEPLRLAHLIAAGWVLGQSHGQ